MDRKMAIDEEVKMAELQDHETERLLSDDESDTRSYPSEKKTDMFMESPSYHHNHHQQKQQQPDPNRFWKAVSLGLLTVITCLLGLGYVVLRRHPEDWNLIAGELPPSVSACNEVPEYASKQLRSLMEPSIHVFYKGKPVHPADVLPPHVDLCIMVTVPQTPLTEYRQTPVPGTGPDSIHMIVNSTEVYINLTPPKPLPNQGENLLFKDGVLIYFKETSLHHSGTYEVNAEIEHSNWEWALQWHDDTERNVTVFPTGIEIPFENDWIRAMQLVEVKPQTPAKVISQSYKFPPYLRVGRGDRQRRPFCSDKVTPLRGRWHAAMSFDVPGGMVDEWGFAWDGNDCHLQYYTDRDTMDCLADRSVYIHGDSNSRRIAKTIISGGHYCHNLSHLCQDYDASEPVFKLVEAEDGGALQEVEETEYPRWVLFSDEWLKLGFGRNSTMMFGFQRTLVTNWGDWTRKLYDRKDWSVEEQELEEVSGHDQPLFRPGIDLRPGAKARSQPDKPVPDLVLVAMGTWDETFSAHYADIEDAAPRFADAIREAFPNSVIVLRLTHGTCCQKNMRDNLRYSGVRFQHINEIIQKAFDIQIGESQSRDGRVLLLDSAPLGATKDEGTDYEGHFVGHLRFSRIRTETQMMLNMVCKKDPHTGRASWRWS